LCFWPWVPLSWCQRLVTFFFLLRKIHPIPRVSFPSVEIRTSDSTLCFLSSGALTVPYSLLEGWIDESNITFLLFSILKVSPLLLLLPHLSIHYITSCWFFDIFSRSPLPRFKGCCYFNQRERVFFFCSHPLLS